MSSSKGVGSDGLSAGGWAKSKTMEEAEEGTSFLSP